jgi:membrane protein
MSTLSDTNPATNRGRKPSWLGGLALIATYAAAMALNQASAKRTGATKSRQAAPAAVVAPRKAAAVPSHGWAYWKHVLYRTYQEIGEDRLLALAAGVVFYGLLAIFPAITALVSSYALFAKASTINSHLASIAGMMPPGPYKIIDEQVTRIVSQATGSLGLAFLSGLALALWSANAGIKAIIDALNIVYGVKERRGFFLLNAVSLAFTASVIVGLLLAIGAIVVLPVVMSYLPFGSFGAMVLAWLRWPAMLIVLMLGLAVLYRFGPNLDHPRWHWFTPGALFAAVAWLGGSAILSYYLGHFANYDATYGSLGAAIGLMMWLWMTSIVVLVGAELNSEIDAANGVQPPQEEKIGGA